MTAKERCISSARLVAMQLSLLSHNQQVINLERHEVTAFLEKHTSFQQVRMLLQVHSVKQYRYTVSHGTTVCMLIEYLFYTNNYSMLIVCVYTVYPHLNCTTESVLCSLICTVQHNLYCVASSVLYNLVSILYSLICTV